MNQTPLSLIAKPKNVLVLDTETSGLEPKTDRILELAATVFSVEHKCPVLSFSTLIADARVVNLAERVNRIPSGALPKGRSEKDAVHAVLLYASACDAFVAHGAAFDEWFMRESVARTGLMWPTIPWVDSMSDVEWPEGKRGESLVATALAHGVGVANAHRAMADVDTLVRLMQRVSERHDLGALLARGMRPKVHVVSMAPFEQKDVVKEHGFHWDGAKRVWWRDMPAEDVGSLPFRTRIV